MKLKSLFLKRNLVAAFAMMLSGAIAHAQTTATWIGPTSGGLWNTDANWDTGLAPGDTTNVFLGSANNVSYNFPMTAASFGILTNNGTINVNTNGFNSGQVLMLNPGGTSKLFLNPGGAMSVNGSLGLMSNAVIFMTNSSLTVSGTLFVGSGTNGTGNGGNPNCLARMTNNGGFLNLGGLALNQPNGSVGNGTANLVVINGGTNNLGNVFVGRASGSTLVALDSEGLVLNSGLVQMTRLSIGNNSWGLVQIKPGVILTNTGMVTLQNATVGRPARLIQTGGFFTTTDPRFVLMSPSGTGDTAYSILGGTNSIGGLQFGAFVTNFTLQTNIVDDVTNIVVAATNITSTPGVVYFTNAATINIGSVGIFSNGAVTINASLNTGGRLVSATDWTNAAPLSMNGGTFECQDLSGTPHNIYSSGALRGSGSLIKNGGGTMTLAAANVHAGSTIINAGTLALLNDGVTTFGSLANSVIINVGAGATFDVSQTLGFVLGASRTIAGKGTVVGAFAASDNSSISPAGASAQGTLTFTNGLAATNAIFTLELSDDPTGTLKLNDALNVAGNLTVNGNNVINVTPVGSLGSGTYTLIRYSGSLIGTLANFSCLSGTLTNPPGRIDLIVVSPHQAAKLVWRGDGAANLWDTVASSNWFNGTGLDRFYSGDTNVFDDSATNLTVNLSGILTPAAGANVLINATKNYTFSGDGTISGVTGLTKTNTGKLTINATNNYTGVTTISGGTLSVPSLANGGLGSPIGAAGTSPANLVFDNGTLEYTGGDATVNRGMTFQSGGSTLSFSNSTLTLSGLLTGSGTLTKTGNGQLSLPLPNDYSGGTVVKSGTIRTAQGSSTAITAIGNGSLTLSGTNSTAALLFGGDQETLNNTLNVVGALNYITNNGNDTISAIAGSGTLHLEGAGANVLSLQSSDLSGFTGTLAVGSLGNLRIFNGTLNAAGVTFDLGTNNSSTALLNNRNGSLTAQIGALVGGPATRLQGASSANNLSTYLIGGKNLDTTFSGSITEVATNRIVAITKVGTGTLTLDGAFTEVITLNEETFLFETNNIYTNALHYTGNTTISNGVLKIAGSASLASSSNIILAANSAILDVSKTGNPDSSGTNLIVTGIFELTSTQTLVGVGTILATNVLTDLGSIVSPGLPFGTLTASQKIQLAGAVGMSINAASSPNCSKIAASTIVVDSTATLTVTNLGPEANATFQLFNHPVNFTGGVVLPGLTGTNTWVNNLATDGSITMIAPQLILVNTNSPTISSSFAGGVLSLSWPPDHLGWKLQAQTNSLNSGIGTNWIDVAGSQSGTNATITINPLNGTVFFRLVYP